MGTEGGECIMWECSFFYYSNMDKEEATMQCYNNLLQDCNNNKDGDKDSAGGNGGIASMVLNLRAVLTSPREVQTHARHRWMEQRYWRQLCQSIRNGFMPHIMGHKLSHIYAREVR
jgi:hypothetical protein